ncbi:MAG: RNA polymerase sigma factor [bacterium]
MPSLSDEQLLALIQNRSTSAFESLYRRYKDRIHAFAYRLVKDRTIAEDIVQDTFLKTYQSALDILSPTSFRAWIFSVARNEAYKHMQKEHVKREFDEDSGEFLNLQTPLENVMEKEKKEILQLLLDSLLPKYREVLILCEYEGMSYAEIAVVTGDTESSVKSRVFKARRALIKHYTQQYCIRGESNEL